jgi:superfamily II DNA/RNA helicase
VASISSEKYPSIRQKKLSLFEKGEIECLICTDISTRGIDFNVPQVVNYDLPVNSKTYIHRVGRTARKNQQGTAITLLADNQVKLFKKMINNIPREGRMRRTLADEEEMKLLEGKFEQVLSLMKDKFGSNRIRKATEEISFNPVKKLKMAPLSYANSESKSSDSSSESDDSNDAEIAKSPDSLYVDPDGTPAFAPFGHPAWIL